MTRRATICVNKGAVALPIGARSRHFARMPRLFLTICLALVLPIFGARLSTAAPRLAEATGTVSGFDTGQSLLDVNTRLGSKLFLVRPTTLILLNNHTATTDSIELGDDVTVTYRFDTSEATQIHLFREARSRGRITAVGTGTMDLRKANGAVVRLRPDANSRVELEDILLVNQSVLVGRQASAVFEPGTLVLLSLAARSSRAEGRVQSRDTTAKTVTLAGGRTPRVFTLDAAATVRRNGAVAALADIQVGDRVTIAFVRTGTIRKALAVRARGNTGS